MTTQNQEQILAELPDGDDTIFTTDNPHGRILVEHLDGEYYITSQSDLPAGTITFWGFALGGWTPVRFDSTNSLEHANQIVREFTRKHNDLVADKTETDDGLNEMILAPKSETNQVEKTR
ncbi:MAG: hypothetical protein OXG88_01170 [Gammaproteobacteria bacterium]|nr:hypothetical protein [Gammaproteobacteria bacterium]